MTRPFNHRDWLMHLSSVKSSEKSTSIQKITGCLFVFCSMKIVVRLRCVGASQCRAAEYCAAGRGAAINTVEHQWRGHVCSAVFSVEGKVWERLIPRVSQSSLSPFHFLFCWCALFQRVFLLMCLAASFPHSHSLKLFYSVGFVKHKAPYRPLPSPLPCSTFSLSPISVCFMQNNWFRKLFIHILHVPCLIRSWNLWVFNHSDLSGGVTIPRLIPAPAFPW